MISMRTTVSVAHDLRLLEETGLGRVEDVLGRVRQRPEAAAFDEHRLLVEQFVRAHDLAVGGEQRRVGKPLLDELERHEPVIDVMEIRARELDDVHLDALDREPVEQRADELFRALVQIKRAMDEVDADDAQRLLLLDVLLVQHAHVDDDLVRFRARVRLVADAHPAVALAGVVVGLGGHGVGKGKKARPPAALVRQPLDEQIVLVFEHLVEPLAADVARTGPVDGVGKRHVVGRDRLGDGARRAADVEKLPRDLLARADFREGAVLRGVEIDLERLFIDRVIPFLPRHHHTDVHRRWDAAADGVGAE